MQRRRLTEVLEQHSDRNRLGEKDDESYLATAMGPGRQKDFVDSRQEHGPRVAGGVGLHPI